MGSGSNHIRTAERKSTRVPHPPVVVCRGHGESEPAEGADFPVWAEAVIIPGGLPREGALRHHRAARLKGVSNVTNDDETTLVRIESCLDRMKAGDPSARDDLIRMSYHRFDHLVRKMIRKSERVTDWEEVDDVVQNAALRLWRSLEKIIPKSRDEFLGLAATQVRRELIDLARHYFGPEGPGVHEVGGAMQRSGEDGSTLPAYEGIETTYDPTRLALWTEFHHAVESLPADERRLCELLWYLGLPQSDVASALGVDVSTVKRRWRTVRVKLHRTVQGWDGAD